MRRMNLRSHILGRKSRAWGGRREPGTWLPPVGSTETQADHQADRYGFTHQEMLDNVNLIHMNGRVYDPTLGRFLSVDPIFEFPTNTQSLNPYSYVLNNPLSMTDPTGYTPEVACSTGSTKSTESCEATYTPTGSHIAIHDYATVQKNGDVAAGSTDPGAAQAMVHAASQLFGGNGQQNRNNGPGSGVDLGKTAQSGPMAQNTGGIAANTNAATGSQTQTRQATQANNPSQGRIEQYVGQQANAYGVPRKIGIAVVQKESSFNVNAVNKNRNGTTDYGLMMVNSGNFGHKVMGANGELFTIRGSKVKGDWKYNVKVGMSILQSAYGFARRYAPSDVTAATYARYNAWSEWKFYTKPGTQVYIDVQGFLKIYNGLRNGP